MSVTSAEGANSPMEANAPLGVGSIVSDSFSILFKNIIKVMLLGFVPMMIGLVASGVLVSWEFALSGGEAIGVAPSITGIIVSVLLQMAIYGVIVALLIQLAYDAKQGRSHSLLAYFGPALKSAFPIAILALVSGVLVGIAAIALIIPGIWLYAVFSVMAPAVVIDRAGFGALGRSASLTKGYRWPIVGTLIVIGICTFVLSFVASFVFGVVGGVLGTGGVGIVLSVVVVSLINAFVYGLSGISVALIYARLREIKEGVSVDQLAAVFE